MGAHVNFVCCSILYRMIALSVPTASNDPSEENLTQQTALVEQKGQDCDELEREWICSSYGKHAPIMGISRAELYVHLAACIGIEDGQPSVSFLDGVGGGCQRV